MVTAGRPPVWNPFPALASSAWTELLVFTSKDRATMPAAARNLLGLRGGEKWLADLAQPGVASLRGLADAEGLAAALGGSDIDPDLAIAAMDRFQVVSMSAEGRLSLSPSLLSHLDALVSGAVRLVVRQGSLTLLSERRWTAQREARAATLDRLVSKAASR
ncbi:hypothetical protein SR41_16660 [Sphingomonas melonis]|uniref:Uncharacterized protein n=1 Tax=Sphingomonas melonis TaxID=152682 RepID=A0A0D1JXR7_9SPHN|nr:hypothetical protein SR41_16660 [Sphingomonas melonis]